MPTFPHTDPDNGYAIRVGKHLPKHAANLAYVHTDTPTPGKNVLVRDLTDAIPENSLRREEKESFVATVNKDGLLETKSGLLSLSRPDILITDQYTVDTKKAPLFYIYRSKFLFDARRSLLSQPIHGSAKTKTKLFEEYDSKDRDLFIYDGDKIKVTRTHNLPLLQTDRYKIVLEKENKKDFLYRVCVYTNFLNKEESYELHYPSYENEKNVFKKESLNPRTVFSEQTLLSNREKEKHYKVIRQEDGNYAIRLEQTGEEDLLITESNRPSHLFQYQLISKISTRFSDKNPLSINIGIIYINDTVINAVRTVSALKKLVYDNPYMPDYLSFENPHSLSGYHDPADSTYWETSLNMPKEHWLDYDVLIISGYGDKDFSTVSDAMRDYLSIGGILLFDNSGTGSNVLNPINQSGKQTFIADLSFSSKETEKGIRSFTQNANMKDRYYEVKEPHKIGRVSPTIQFRGTENINDWSVYLTHQNGGPSLMKKETGSIGQLIVSNMGWMLDVIYGKKEAIQFFSNFLLYLVENRAFISPTFNQSIYHKDDLYQSEYKDTLGQTRYADDRSDEDGSQIVAKRILSPNTSDFAKRYLPEPYRTWQEATFETKVSDSGIIPVNNSSVELTNPDGETTWNSTTLEALPGFDFVKFSGDSTQGIHSSAVFKDGYRSLNVKTINSSGYFEQEMGIMQPGKYVLSAFVKADNSQGGGVALYKTDGTLIKASKEMTGTSNWTKIEVLFTLDEATDTVIRFGAHSKNQSINLFFDEITLKTTGVVRMTQKNTGQEPLYAYAISPRGKNTQLSLLEQTKDKSLFTLKDAKKEATLVVKSFVYQWYSEEVRYKKEYGNQKNTRFKIQTSDKEKVLGNIQQFLPALKSGAEWARKDRVYYEVSLDPSENSDFINISLYDPSTDNFFFNAYGEWVLNHDDIWWNGYDSTVQVRAELELHHVLATASQYTLKQKEENQIKLSAPATEDERDRWYLRVQNGSFKKSSLNTKDKSDLNASGREGFYDEFLSGEHDYQLPEYRNQSFYPNYGERFIEQELAVYVNDHTIKVQRGPLLIEEENVDMERLNVVDSKKTIWKSRHILWDKTVVPKIYVDEWQDGRTVLMTEGFRIDYKEGRIYFNESVNGTVFATYRYDNFQIKKRKYANKQIKAELLRSRDNYTYEMKEENITVTPAPVFYRGTVSENTRIHPASYWIDFEEGTITFFQETRERIYADYLYYREEELEWEDADQYSGEIRLKQRVSFKDEIYVTYLAQENSLEYKGYYDEERQAFVSLDLNPTAGHTFSLKQKVEGIDQYIQVPGEKLLNKEIYLYLLPYKSLYYKKEVVEENTIRHCFEEKEWQKIKAANPTALLLGIIQVRENTSPEQIVMMDARRLGGGIKENVSQESIEKRVGYTSAFWDIGSFDGLAYYKNGVSIIRLPKKVLVENGGHVKESDIQRILEKYLAYGIYPIVKYTED